MDANPSNHDSVEPSNQDEAEPTLAGRIEYRPQTTLSTNATLVAQADRVEISRGIAGALIASEASFSKGYTSVTVARELSMDKAGSQWMLAGEAHLTQGGVGIVVAREVDATDMKVGVLLAGNVNGNVEAMFDRDSAMRFGAAFGLVLGILLMLRRIVR